MTLRITLAAVTAALGFVLWNPAQAADPPSTFIGPLQLTAHATYDTVYVSWDSAISEIVYSVKLYKDYEYWNYSGFFLGPSRTFSVGPHAPYKLTIDELEPDTNYVISVTTRHGDRTYYDIVPIRTEPVPVDWWDVNVARNIRTSAHSGRILVTWECLDAPLVSDLEVEIKEYGAPKRTALRHSVACAANEMVSEPALEGTVYDIVIWPLGLEHYQQKLIRTIPGAIRESETVDDVVPTWDISVEYSRGMVGWVFTVSVDADEGNSLFEVEWIKDGYRMSRVGQGPTFVYHSASGGPFPFRLRRVDDHAAQSVWSLTRFAGVPHTPPYTIKYQNRESRLHVGWWSPPSTRYISGDRAYLYRDGAPPQVVDAGTSGEATFELDPSESRYVLLVGSYHQELGVGRLSRIDIDLEEEPELSLRVDGWQPDCQLASDTPMRGFWSVKHGVPPYRVTVGAQEPVTSVLPLGAFESGCTLIEGERTDGGDVFTQVTVEVEDGLGRRMDGSLSYEIEGHGEVGAAAVTAVNKPGAVNLEMHEPRVGSTGIGRTVQYWSGYDQYWYHRFVIRWRTPGEQEWIYTRDDVKVELTRVVTVNWGGLAPDTSYQYQMAVDIPGVLPEEIPEEAWSDLQEVRTLPAQFDTEVLRVGTFVIVRWNPSPSSRHYSVVLRGEDESWWKAHFSRDETDTEAVVFTGIPADAVFDVEVMTPPVGATAWDGYRG